MAHTVADWWAQYVVGPAFLYLIIGVPVWGVFFLGALLGQWEVPHQNRYLAAFWFVGVLSVVIVVSGAILTRWPRPVDGRGEGADD